MVLGPEAARERRQDGNEQVARLSGETRDLQHGKIYEDLAHEERARTQATQQLHRLIADLAAEPRAGPEVLDSVRAERAERERQLASLEDAVGGKLQETVRQTAESLLEVRREHESLREIVAKIIPQIESAAASPMSPPRPTAGTGEGANSGHFPSVVQVPAAPPPQPPLPVPAWPETPGLQREAPGSQTDPGRLERVRRANVLGYAQPPPGASPFGGGAPGGWHPADPGNPFGAKGIGDPFQSMVDRSNTSTPTRNRAAAPPDAWPA
ncbi:unnamed protein product [Prorocentrum cordatum]|uniref:Uncharacterized protein n=1 Tax=Prorocentrum cordatum TaxID=2364126 RepID=A0ABN9RJ55_9DINO|nr:unnamed protein product [Polarella glacialis]